MSVVDTPHGPAEIVLEGSDAPSLLVVLGHGAGGGVEAPDLLAVRDVVAELGGATARVLQPYRVAGRRAPAPAGQLDTAWAAVLAALRERWPGVPQVHGGRSSGARVACRGAAALDPADRPVGVLALAFPLRPPGKARPSGGSGDAAPRADRGPELDAATAAGVPVLVVNGARDRFGVPDPAPGREVVVIAGDHSLRARGPVADAVRPWLARRAGSEAP